MNNNLAADVLLVTVTDVETESLLATAKAKTGRDYVLRPVAQKTYFDLGVIGGVSVLAVRSEMGSDTMGGSLITVKDAIAAVKPTSVIMVGIAFGVDASKQKIGDVLIAKQLQAYDLQRVGITETGAAKIIFRGDKPHCSEKLLDRFRTTRLKWKKAEVNFGLVLSGEKLIDNVDFRDQLVALSEEAIGGEMEGGGLYVACQQAKVDWILVKAICDWADGKKDVRRKARQKKAAENSAAFVLEMLATRLLASDRQPTQKHAEGQLAEGRSLSLTMTKPSITKTAHILPFGELSPAQFERLCLWLISSEGYLRPEHLGEAGNEQGRDIIAYRGDTYGQQLWYFQCKRYQTINAKALIEEVEKYNSLATNDRTNKPFGVVFITNATLSAKAREKVREFCGASNYECEFWARTELDMRVKKYAHIVSEFFDVKLTEAPSPTSLAQVPVEKSPFVLKGSIPPAAACYVERKCDSEILEVLIRSRLIAIIGGDQIGKSSLLNRIRAHPPHGWMPCYLDLQTARTDDMNLLAGRFFKTVSGVVGGTEDWDELAGRAAGQPLILLIDEFGALECNASVAAYFIQKLVRLADSPSVRIVASLSGPIEDFIKKQNIANPKYWDSWQSITVKPFLKSEVLALLRLLPEPAARIAFKNHEAIMIRTRNLPHLLQELCDRLFRAVQNNEPNDSLVAIINC